MMDAARLEAAAVDEKEVKRALQRLLDLGELLRQVLTDEELAELVQQLAANDHSPNSNGVKQVTRVSLDADRDFA